MMGDVHGSGLVRHGLDIHMERPFRIQCIGKIYIQVAREAFLAVRVQKMKADGGIRNFRHVPDQIVYSLEPAVKGIFSVVVNGRIVLHAVHAELSIAYAVCNRPHGCAKETLPGRSYIILKVPVPYHNVLPFSVTVFGESGHHAGAEICHLHGYIAVLQRVQFNGLSVNFPVKRR